MSDEAREEVVAELTDAIPGGGFIVVTVEEKEGSAEHIRTFSNLPDEVVQ
ncbi:hypothetical protein [Hyphomicrobium sp.]|nr:hypothetical protein [Hyphomicrobium sp.]